VLRENVLECLNGAMMTGDGYLLELAFAALLQNALEATQSGDRIVISGRKAHKPLRNKSIARIAIVDSGSGMEKNILAKAADPFVTSKRDRDGLGLSMASRVVEIHGGQLKISSVSGKGSKVEIMLPVTFARAPSDG
jgi:signal transduction histidine kinase